MYCSERRRPSWDGRRTPVVSCHVFSLWVDGETMTGPRDRADTGPGRVGFDVARGVAVMMADDRPAEPNRTTVAP